MVPLSRTATDKICKTPLYSHCLEHLPCISLETGKKLFIVAIKRNREAAGDIYYNSVHLILTILLEPDVMVHLYYKKICDTSCRT